MIPTLTTARLTLRPPVMADFEAYAAALAGPAAAYMGGPRSRDGAWDWFASDVAQWHLRGHGSLTVTEGATAVGQVNIVQPPHFPEPELGWIAYAGRTGRGLMAEAAAALRDWAFGPRGLATLVSYIDPANAPSVRLAQRLGARPDPAAATPGGMATGVWRLTAGGAA